MKSVYLVLMPGLDGTGLLFRPLLKALPEFIKPIIVSYPTDKILGYDKLTSYIVEHLPNDEPFVLLGESFGGPLALKVAARKPVMLKGVVLCASFVACPFPFIPLVTKKLLRPFLFSYLKLFAKLNAYAGSRLSVDIEKSLSLTQNEVLAERVKEIMQVDVSRELDNCDLPILYLRGIKDYVVPKWNLQRILKIKPNINDVSINSSHMLLQTQAVQAVEAIHNFIAGLKY